MQSYTLIPEIFFHLQIIFSMDLLWTGWFRIESILQKDRYLAYEASRPVTGAASKGAALFRRKAAEQAKKDGTRTHKKRTGYGKAVLGYGSTFNYCIES